jgi:hypothetical protein
MREREWAHRPALKSMKARLVELADEVGGLHDEALDRGRVARIGSQVAAADLMRREERQPTREIDDDVAGRGRAVAS